MRYLVWGDAPQAARASRVIEGNDGVVLTTTVLCETVWVLRRAYRLGQGQIAKTLRELVRSRGVQTDRPAVEAGLAMLMRGGDFADGVILHEAARLGASSVASFDAAFIALGGDRVIAPDG